VKWVIASVAMAVMVDGHMTGISVTGCAIVVMLIRMGMGKRSRRLDKHASIQQNKEQGCALCPITEPPKDCYSPHGCRKYRRMNTVAIEWFPHYL
jgi:hypothetical protein